MATSQSFVMERSIITQLNLDIPAGKIVLLSGEQTQHSTSRGGVATLLKVIAGSLSPEIGFVYHPANWRVNYLDESPRLFDLSVRANLLYGYDGDHAPGEGVRDHASGEPLITEPEIYTLCEALGIPGEWLREHMDDDAMKLTVGHAGQRVNMTVRVLICIARVLFAQPQVMLVSCLFDSLAPEHVLPIVKVLVGLVRDRGLPQILSTEYQRNPFLELRKKRTVIVKTRVPEIAKIILAENDTLNLDPSGQGYRIPTRGAGSPINTQYPVDPGRPVDPGHALTWGQLTQSWSTRAAPGQRVPPQPPGGGAALPASPHGGYFALTT